MHHSPLQCIIRYHSASQRITAHYKTPQKTPQEITMHLTVHYKTSQHTTVHHNASQRITSHHSALQDIIFYAKAPRKRVRILTFCMQKYRGRESAIPHCHAKVPRKRGRNPTFPCKSTDEERPRIVTLTYERNYIDRIS